MLPMLPSKNDVGGCRSGRSVLSACQTIALFSYGNHQTRTNSCDVQSPADHLASTVDNRCLDCLQMILNAGSVCNVTSTITPNAPSDNSAARKSAGLLLALHRTNCPFARTIDSDRKLSEISPCWSELPCVPVATTPATDWLSMLPRFDSVIPYSASSRPRSCSRMPAWTVTMPVFWSTFRIRLKSSRLMSHDEVQVRSDGEWPLPTVTRRRRHRRASVTIFWTSSIDCGRRYSSGREKKVFAHV